MKKIISLFVALLFCGGVVFSQVNTKVIKAGTVVPLQSVDQVKAADVEEGQIVNFKVVQDVCIDGTCVIPGGTLVKGKVTEAKKSSLAGTKGRLKISINSLNLPSGEPVYFTNSDVNISGKNRTPLAVVTGLFVWPCIFIPGTKAVMPAGYETLATVAANTTVTIE